MIEMEELSVYDIKDHDHMYAKFQFGHIFVRVESAPVCTAVLLRSASHVCSRFVVWTWLSVVYCTNVGSSTKVLEGEFKGMLGEVTYLTFV